MSKENIEYSEKYFDNDFEYRQVILPRDWGNIVKEKGLLTEEEWRKLGISQSKGWAHYATHPPEPHILLFRRPLGTNPRTGELDSGCIESTKREAEAKRRVYISKL